MILRPHSPSPRSSPEEADDEQEYDRSNGRRCDGVDDPVTDMHPQISEEVEAYKCTNDADDDIPNKTKPAALSDQTGEPAGHEADDQENDKGFYSESHRTFSSKVSRALGGYRVIMTQSVRGHHSGVKIGPFSHWYMVRGEFIIATVRTRTTWCPQVPSDQARARATVGHAETESFAMRFVLSYTSFVLTLVVGALLFAFLAIEFPGITRQLMDEAKTLPGYLSSLGLSDKYMIWVDILLTGEKILLLGCMLVTRLLFSLIGAVVGPLIGDGSRSSSQFEGWGR